MELCPIMISNDNDDGIGERKGLGVCPIKMMVTIDDRKSGLILKLGKGVRWIWTQGWQRPASVSTTGAINEIFPLNFFFRNFSAKLFL